jgi:YggT family protein
MAFFLRNFIELLALALTVLILARVLLSWVDTGGRSRLSAFVFQATEPILAPIRGILPKTGILDLSPMIAIFLLTFLLQAFR